MTNPEIVTEIEARLLGHPGVRDCVALAREASAGSREIVLYVVPNGPFDAEELVAHVRGVGELASLPVSAVPIAVVPLDDEGRVDVPALARLPVVDRTSVEQWEEYLRAERGLKEAAVLMEPARPPPAVLHLDDLLPDPVERSEGLEDSRVPEAEAVGEVTPTAAAPAVRDGGLLRVSADAPRTLCDTLRRATARSAGHGISYVQVDDTLVRQSYEELLQSAERVLGGVRRLGLRPGDRAVFQFSNNRDFLTAFWGCVLGGVIPVPVAVAPTYVESNSATHKLMAAWEMLGQPVILTDHVLADPIREFADRNGMRGCRVAILNELERNPPEQHWETIEPQDIAVIMLTSGSTGVPKGVRLTHANLIARSAGSVQMNGFTENEITLNWMPLDHVAGILFFHLRDVFLGCRQIHCPTAVVLGDPLRWLDLIDQHRCTITFAPNFAYGLINAQADEIARRRWDLSSMRFVLNGAEPIVARTARQFLTLLIPHGLPPTAMYPAWGMSETSSGVTYSHRFSLETVDDDDSFVEVGRPIPGVSFRVVDDDGRVVAERVVGHLQVKGTTVTPGYYDESLNADAFTADGWFRTGDLALLDDGALTITGRAKDVIIINSVNYYSHELEAAVEELPGITRSFTAACAVRGTNEDTDKLALFFHTAVQTDTELRTLLGKIRQNLVQAVGVNPDYLLPVECTDIPKTEIGKIQRPLLAQRFEAGVFDEVRKRVDVLMQNERTLPDWFFHRVWRRSERLRSHPDDRTGSWVVFVDEGELGEAVCRMLEAAEVSHVRVQPGRLFERCSERRYVIDPTDGRHYRRLVEEVARRNGPIAQTVHLWALDGALHAHGDEGDVAAEAQRRMCSVLHWIQALAGVQDGDGRTGLLVVGSGAQAVLAGDPVAADGASVLGIVKASRHELPWLECRHVDVTTDDPSRAAERLVREATAMTPESEVAYREGKRFVPRLAKAEVAGSGGTPAVRHGGMYVLSGGLGGIGREIARVLLERFEARVLVLGRTVLSPDGIAEVRGSGGGDQPPESRLASLERLPGTIRYVAVDVCDAPAVRRAVEAAEEEWQTSVSGVFHLAGVHEECTLLDETPARIEATLRPKLLGAWVLSQLCDERPGSFFLAFSSVVSFFGEAMAGAYTAANIALEALVQRRRRDGDDRSVCSVWSRWLDVGMSRGFDGLGLLQAKGYRPVTVREGVLSLLVALQHNHALLYIGLDGSSPHIRASLNSLEGEACGITALYSGDASDTVAGRPREIELRDRFGNAVVCAQHQLDVLPRDPTGAIDRSALHSAGDADGRGTSFEVPSTDLERCIAEIWSRTLRRESLDVRDNFFDLGGNSILMAQVNSALRTALGREVSLTDMFQYPTIGALAEYLGNGPSSVGPALVSSRERGAARRAKMRARMRGSRSK